MGKIDIVPIFNQAAPNVWDNFMNIRMAAMHHVYSYKMSSSEHEDALKQMMLGWKKRSFNFAFGAFDNGDMVGFINGDCVDNVATIRGLYVLPECMSQKVGGRLLKIAEKIGSFGARSLDLVSCQKSKTFYEHYDYTPITEGSNRYMKKITSSNKPHCATLPVFYITQKLDKTIKKISSANKSSFDAEHVNNLHAPMYMYIDADCAVQGVLLGNDKNYEVLQLEVAPHQPKSFIESRLNREFELLRNQRNKVR